MKTRRQYITNTGQAALISAIVDIPLQGADVEHLDGILEPIRLRADLPALAAVVLMNGAIVGKGAVGVRKYGDSTEVTMQDQFHLGSCTKAMTAHLCALLMESGSLKHDTPLAEALPEMAATMAPAYRKITLDHLLCQQSGFPGESWLRGRSFQETRLFTGSPQQQREHYVREILRESPAADPGTQFIYSNRNFALAGYLAERALKTGWEELLSTRVFKPLGIKSGGYGAMGSPGHVDQPWQHVIRGTDVTSNGPGPNSDNPDAIGPAGKVHMSLEDWGKFVADHLKGLRNEKAQLKPASYHYLHQPLFGGDYMGGWMMTTRSWGGGEVFTHTGSNTQNFAVVWMAPLKNFAVLIATNLGGDKAGKTCDTAAGMLIQKILN